MAGPIPSVLLPLFVEEVSPLISLKSGEITPEMSNSIDQMRAFKGSDEEAEAFFGEMIKELIAHMLSDLTARDVT